MKRINRELDTYLEIKKNSPSKRRMKQRTLISYKQHMHKLRELISTLKDSLKPQKHILNNLGNIDPSNIFVFDKEKTLFQRVKQKVAKKKEPEPEPEDVDMDLVAKSIEEGRLDK